MDDFVTILPNYYDFRNNNINGVNSIPATSPIYNGYYEQLGSSKIARMSIMGFGKGVWWI